MIQSLSGYTHLHPRWSMFTHTNKYLRCQMDMKKDGLVPNDGVNRSKKSISMNVHRRNAGVEMETLSCGSLPGPSGVTSMPVVDLMQRLLANCSLAKDSTSLLTFGILGGSIFLAYMEPGIASAAVMEAGQGNHHGAVIGDLAENSDFWANVLRYVSYFFSVLLGTVYVALKPIADLLKRPTTAVLVLGAVAALYFFVSTTVSAMLGLNDIVDYSPSSIVTGQSY